MKTKLTHVCIRLCENEGVERKPENFFQAFQVLKGEVSLGFSVISKTKFKRFCINSNLKIMVSLL